MDTVFHENTPDIVGDALMMQALCILSSLCASVAICTAVVAKTALIHS
jgi:hypothetical protein